MDFNEKMHQALMKLGHPHNKIVRGHLDMSKVPDELVYSIGEYAQLIVNYPFTFYLPKISANLEVIEVLKIAYENLSREETLCDIETILFKSGDMEILISLNPQTSLNLAS